MSDFNASSAPVNSELSEAQSSYRTINAMLQSAKRRGNKTEVRELTRSKARISKRLDQLKGR